MTTTITSSPGSAITPATAGKNLKTVAGYKVSADDNTFIKEQDVALYATGLRPSTRLYIFLDGIRLSEYSTPATTADYTKTNIAISDLYTSGSRGDATYSDSSGNFAAIVHIPAGSFFTGDRLFIITDVDNLNSASASTTRAVYTFHTFNNNAPVTLMTPSAATSAPPEPQTPISTSSADGGGGGGAASCVGKWMGMGPEAGTAPGIDAAGNPVYFTWWEDPLAQSFYVGLDGLVGVPGIFVTSLDLYFQTKDAVQGVTVDIRTTLGGYPTRTPIPYSSITLDPSSVNISSDASTATTISFKSPIFLSADTHYVIVVTPNGNTPNYKLFTSEVGGSDITSNAAVNKNWGQGDLFTSTNGDTWNPVPNEFMKFTLNRAEFTSTANSSVSLVNKDYEFIYMANAYGYFEQGEYVFKLASNVAFTNSSASSNSVLINANSYTLTLQGLTGTITSGFTQFSNTTILIASNGSSYDTLFVNNVSNTTSLTIKNVPKFSGNVTVQWTPTAKIYTYDINDLDLTLIDSTASNSAFKFTQNSTVIGVTSNANTQINVLRDRVINRFMPFFHNLTLPTATIDFQLLNTISNTYGNTVVKSYNTTNMNTILDSEVIISSRSNEITNMAGRKSFSANLVLSSTSGYISPLVDIPTSSVIAYRNKIDANQSNEETKTGTAINKYISKTINLASGLDSEDLIVYLDAYRPSNTYINVYGKFLSATDPESFDMAIIGDFRK